MFVHSLTPEEKEQEKRWVDEHLGFRATWREGWVMYDGTIVVLYRCPGMQGETYYTRKGNYGLNVQVWCSISNMLWLMMTCGSDWKCTFESPNRGLFTWVYGRDPRF